MIMNEPRIFILADQALLRVIEQIKDDQWEMKLPEWFQLRSAQARDSMNLRLLVNYHAYDDAWVPDVLTGKTMDEVGLEKYKGDLLGDDPKGNYRAIAEKAIAAVGSLVEADLARSAHLTYGELPVREYLKHTMSFRSFRVYDIAKLIGTDTTLSDELVQGMWDTLEPVADDWRKMGVFGPAVEVAEDATLQQKLFGLVGRS
jgi:hypothetical protein